MSKDAFFGGVFERKISKDVFVFWMFYGYLFGKDVFQIFFFFFFVCVVSCVCWWCGKKKKR